MGLPSGVSSGPGLGLGLGNTQSHPCTCSYMPVPHMCTHPHRRAPTHIDVHLRLRRGRVHLLQGFQIGMRRVEPVRRHAHCWQACHRTQWNSGLAPASLTTVGGVYMVFCFASMQIVHLADRGWESGWVRILWSKMVSGLPPVWPAKSFFFFLLPGVVAPGVSA